MKEIQLVLSPEQAADNNFIVGKISKELKIDTKNIVDFRIIKKSIDARGRYPLVIMRVYVFLDNKDRYQYENTFGYDNVKNAPKVIVVGAGPAGLFASLRLIELGICPIILERGKNISERKVDIANLCRNIGLNEESNFCFGEGGAGTFSDGKLYTRSGKRGNTKRVLEIFHYHGAQDEILYEAHPHIGSNKLSVVVSNIRKTILECGGEIHFNSKVTDILIENSQVTGVKLADNTTLKSKYVVLSTGHSARDIYNLLQNKNIKIQSKGFAVGVRVEHPQELIDEIQYKGYKNKFLPAASYNLVNQVNKRGVYSFCMCPGGMIVPSATEKEQVVVNGMSSSHRNSPFANSGIVVEIHPEDLIEYKKYKDLNGLYFQKYMENLAYVNNGGGIQKAPAQRLDDFVKGRLSSSLPECSYLPGIISSPMHFWLPENVRIRLQEGFKLFNKKMKGFITSEALILGVETRTSSPIRIPRNEKMEHIDIKGLYPCGEGAGYSGGITSSAIDGQKVAENIKLNSLNR